MRHKYLIVLGILLIISSIFSFSLHLNVFVKMNYIFKIPIFAVLGISIIDKMNFTRIFYYIFALRKLNRYSKFAFIHFLTERLKTINKFKHTGI